MSIALAQRLIFENAFVSLVLGIPNIIFKYMFLTATPLIGSLIPRVSFQIRAFITILRKQ
jgi:hypothetical protein